MLEDLTPRGLWPLAKVVDTESSCVALSQFQVKQSTTKQTDDHAIQPSTNRYNKDAQLDDFIIFDSLVFACTFSYFCSHMLIPLSWFVLCRILRKNSFYFLCKTLTVSKVQNSKSGNILLCYTKSSFNVNVIFNKTVLSLDF